MSDLQNLMERNSQFAEQYEGGLSIMASLFHDGVDLR